MGTIYGGKGKKGQIYGSNFFVLDPLENPSWSTLNTGWSWMIHRYQKNLSVLTNGSQEGDDIKKEFAKTIITTKDMPEFLALTIIQSLREHVRLANGYYKKPVYFIQDSEVTEIKNKLLTSPDDYTFWNTVAEEDLSYLEVKSFDNFKVDKSTLNCYSMDDPPFSSLTLSQETKKFFAKNRVCPSYAKAIVMLDIDNTILVSIREEDYNKLKIPSKVSLDDLIKAGVLFKNVSKSHTSYYIPRPAVKLFFDKLKDKIATGELLVLLTSANFTSVTERRYAMPLWPKSQSLKDMGAIAIHKDFFIKNSMTKDAVKLKKNLANGYIQDEYFNKSRKFMRVNLDQDKIDNLPLFYIDDKPEYIEPKPYPKYLQGATPTFTWDITALQDNNYFSLGSNSKKDSFLQEDEANFSAMADQILHLLSTLK